MKNRIKWISERIISWNSRKLLEQRLLQEKKEREQAEELKKAKEKERLAKEEAAKRLAAAKEAAAREVAAKEAALREAAAKEARENAEREAKKLELAAQKKAESLISPKKTVSANLPVNRYRVIECQKKNFENFLIFINFVFLVLKKSIPHSLAIQKNRGYDCCQ